MALSWNSNNTAVFIVVLLLFLILICFTTYTVLFYHLRFIACLYVTGRPCCKSLCLDIIIYYYYTSAEFSVVIFTSVVVTLAHMSCVAFTGFRGTYWITYTTPTVALTMTATNCAVSARSTQVTICVYCVLPHNKMHLLQFINYTHNITSNAAVLIRKVKHKWNSYLLGQVRYSTYKGITEFAGLEFAGLENDGLENEGVEQQQTYILHTIKWTQTNVGPYTTRNFNAQIQIHILRRIESYTGIVWGTCSNNVIDIIDK